MHFISFQYSQRICDCKITAPYRFFVRRHIYFTLVTGVQYPLWVSERLPVRTLPYQLRSAGLTSLLLNQSCHMYYESPLPSFCYTLLAGCLKRWWIALAHKICNTSFCQLGFLPLMAAAFSPISDGWPASPFNLSSINSCEIKLMLYMK